MQVIKPTPSQAAYVLKKFMEEQGTPMKLSQAQEAVARVEGFASWNTLTSAMDPRVGTPPGALKQLADGQYQLDPTATDGVSIQVGTARLRMVPRNTSGFLEMFVEPAATEPSETIWLQGLTTVPNVNARVGETGSTAHLLRSLFQAEQVRDDSCTAMVEPSFLNNEVILEELEEPGTADEQRLVLKFHNGQRTVSVSLRDLKNASHFGGCHWQLPDGNVLVIKSRFAEDGVLDADTRELLRRLLDDDVTLNLPDTEYGVALSYQAKESLEAALYGWDFDPSEEAIRFPTVDKSERGITLHALLKAHQEAADSWRLPSGDRMDVIPAEFNAD